MICFAWWWLLVAVGVAVVGGIALYWAGWACLMKEGGGTIGGLN